MIPPTRWLEIVRRWWGSPADGTLQRLPERAPADRAAGSVEVTTVDLAYQSAAGSVVPSARVPLLCTRSYAHQARVTRAGLHISVLLVLYRIHLLRR